MQKNNLLALKTCKSFQSAIVYSFWWDVTNETRYMCFKLKDFWNIILKTRLKIKTFKLFINKTDRSRKKNQKIGDMEITIIHIIFCH